RARRTRRRPAQVCTEPGKVAALVDVVPCLGERNAEAACVGARQKRAEGAARSEAVGVEEPGVHAARADEVVAGVSRRSHHEGVAVEQREGTGECLGRKMGRVPVEGDHAPAAVAEEERKDGSEPRGEPVALLLDHLDAEPARDVVTVATGTYDRDARYAR